MELKEGILLIDKPSGMTSFDVIRVLRRKFLDARGRDLDEIKGESETPERSVRDATESEKSRDATQKLTKSRPRAPKMGHAGTLDPLATGLMVLGVGKGTKELAHLVKLDKEYIAEILVGESRTTGDMEGEVVEEKEVAEIFSEEKISATLKTMLGTLSLPVSAYSAIKVKGKPMYKRARAAAQRGQTLGTDELPTRDMVVYEAALLAHNNTATTHLDKNTESDGLQSTQFQSEERSTVYPAKNVVKPTIPIDWNSRQVVKVRFKVGSGTYIRSLAEEFGKRLGYPATLYSLRRTKVGEFDIMDAHQLDEF